MQTQRKRPGGTKPSKGKGAKGKGDGKLRDIAPARDAKGGGAQVNVKDSHDRYA